MNHFKGPSEDIKMIVLAKVYERETLRGIAASIGKSLRWVQIIIGELVSEGLVTIGESKKALNRTVTSKGIKLLQGANMIGGARC